MWFRSRQGWHARGAGVSLSIVIRLCLLFQFVKEVSVTIGKQKKTRSLQFETFNWLLSFQTWRRFQILIFTIRFKWIYSQRTTQSIQLKQARSSVFGTGPGSCETCQVRAPTFKILFICTNYIVLCEPALLFGVLLFCHKGHNLEEVVQNLLETNNKWCHNVVLQRSYNVY